MGWKEKFVAVLNPVAGAALTLKEKLLKSPKLAMAAAGAGAAAVTSAARSPPPASAPSGHAPAQRVWTQPAIVLIVGFFVYLYFRMQGFATLARWTLLAVIASAIVGVIFGEPKKALLVLVLPAMIWFLDRMNMLTPANSSLAMAGVVLILLFSFDVAREWINKISHLGIFVFGGILIFWLSAAAQSQLGIEYPHLITTALMLAWIFYVVSRPTPWKWLVIPIYAILFFIFFTTPEVFSPPGSPLYTSIISQRDAWNEMFSAFGLVGKEVARGVRETYYYIGIGDYEQGVEAQSEKPLGVFLEKVDVSSKVVSIDDSIDVYANLRAESFKVERNLSINVRCYEDGFEAKGERQGNVLPASVFNVTEYELQTLDCVFDARDLGEGPHRLTLEASFDFVTSSYLKSYFMEQERIRAYRSQQLDPLDVFGITDKIPIAVFTGGPLKIGMGFDRLPIALVPNYGPSFGITFDRNWLEGELVNVTSITISVPPGIEIKTVDGRPVEKDKYCKGGGKEEYVCTLDKEELLKRVFPEKPVPVPKTIRVQTSVTDINTVLADAPLSIRSFKVTAQYVYRIKKQISVTVRKVVVPKT